MIKLREYQGDTISDSKKQMASNKHILVASPTGSGKTVMFSYISQGVIAKGKKVCLFSNRIELNNQTGSTLSSFGVDFYLIS